MMARQPAATGREPLSAGKSMKSWLSSDGWVTEMGQRLESLALLITASD